MLHIKCLLFTLMEWKKRKKRKERKRKRKKETENIERGRNGGEKERLELIFKTYFGSLCSYKKWCDDNKIIQKEMFNFN